MKYIKLFEAHVNEKKKKSGAEPWWKEYTKYQLSAYPVNIPEENVTVDLSGDIDTHPVMTWISPATDKKVYAYTRARMEAQKEKKYERIGNMSDEEVKRITDKCHEDILSPGTSPQVKDAAAVVCIIAQTGLRPGSRKGFLETENRGVMTLSKDNVRVDGPNIELDFIGKSYKENRAELRDGILANYLQEKMSEESEFLFDVSKDTVDNYYKNTLKMGRFKIKDLRTYMAGKVAKWFLDNDPSAPPPLPSAPKHIKRLIKDKLKRAFDTVSRKLNNTPAMAKGSYIDPAIINGWMESLGVKPAVIMEGSRAKSEPTEFVDNAPVYDMPEWWDNDDIDLIKVD